ncbi:MAG: hypothetical protein ACE5O2_10040 [Armatimonadota bacterium]
MAEADANAGRFEFGVPLTRVWKDDEGQMWFEGVASSTALDKQNERMTKNAIQKMARFRGIDLLPSHRAGPLEELGTVEETFADNDTFRVAGRLDPSNPEAVRLFEKVEGGKAYQLSVGGRVTRAFWADDAEVGKRVKHIDDVVLDHVALCRPGHAVNPDTYLHVMAKSVDADEERQPLPTGRESLALRIGRAILQALRPLAKSVNQEASEAPDAERAQPDAAQSETPSGDSAADLARIESALRGQIRRMRSTIEQLHKRIESLESARGVPMSLPGQEAPHAKSRGHHGRSLWKGVL